MSEKPMDDVVAELEAALQDAIDADAAFLAAPIGDDAEQLQHSRDMDEALGIVARPLLPRLLAERRELRAAAEAVCRTRCGAHTSLVDAKALRDLYDAVDGTEPTDGR